jgi:dTDP-glucose 4,6-dehydratase
VARIIELSGRDVTMTFDRSQPTIPFSLALDIEKARTKYGWQPKVSLDEGIRKTLAWHAEHVAVSV